MHFFDNVKRTIAKLNDLGVYGPTDTAILAALGAQFCPALGWRAEHLETHGIFVLDIGSLRYFYLTAEDRDADQ